MLEICQDVVASCGFKLVEARMQGKSKSLEVTIFNSQKDLSLDDCEHVSRKLEEQLESREPSYLNAGLMIEVQSPGTDRRLKSPREFEVFVGKTVEITLSSKMFDLTDSFTGRLSAFDGKSITVDELVPHLSTKQTKKNEISTATLSQNKLTLDLSQVNTVKLEEGN
jgi:ribosome maturation factor RimP